MRKIIKDGAIVEDSWIHVADDAALPAEGDIIVSWTRWQQEPDTLLKRNGRLGVQATGDVAPEDLAADRDKFSLIALEFPAFKDGRCYSHARLLRDRYGYRGELRAVGDVLRDQLFYMHRVGFNAFEVREDRDPEQALQALKDFDVIYQAAADVHEPVWRRRRSA
ncbi:oxidoreductase [Alkalilimnicola ehrlichii]|uniref:Oxidoreductase n=1 Tax=Alkalilimnicola ehrlichii TaxID=351052 RepID=A0A3E0WSC2_9GAMM|nr:DUF934 domain-containing protein [Alkalilimnicola ehrlichii]RFA28276.1 oxidoreductase [Alkalilimnicola ehrlichii]RFA34876.1 oxidoreductase [Alkalilimnicola ehrlichii]